ncbi:alpha/beta hydrolase [Pedobacter frigiditerrae]|uniref:Alpha/beta hydrolase n=1 Tax=Pedobacter frigiditerrae TaxID=2530452 RepID=A0A4R0MTZ9_9SPHI|nr:alpha/beta hydrolase [Pedobacter frigiditerrae]TCC90197.1 alpha/beta hydrolase [Pedobacter frigiditerrae]
MLKYLLFILAISSVANAQEQHKEWLTGVRDTSYNSQRDFRNNLKKYPFIKLVSEQQMPSVTEKRNLTYVNLGKRSLLIDAFIPKVKNKTAAILIIHGGGWRSGDRSQHIPLAQHLAAKGVASFTVEYRLSTEALYPASVFDVKSAVRWLKANAKKFNVDTNKIALLGFSSGGHLASLVGVTENVEKLEGDIGNIKYSSKVNAVIDIDGTLSFVHPASSEAQNINTNKNGASAMWLGYAGNERLDVWKEASPFTYANENKVPFLFLNSSVERMHAGRDDFKKLMDNKGIYTEIVSFKDSPHSFCLYQPWFDLTVNHITAFVEKVFK